MKLSLLSMLLLLLPFGTPGLAGNSALVEPFPGPIGTVGNTYNSLILTFGPATKTGTENLSFNVQTDDKDANGDPDPGTDYDVPVDVTDGQSGISKAQNFYDALTQALGDNASVTVNNNIVTINPTGMNDGKGISDVAITNKGNETIRKVLLDTPYPDPSAVGPTRIGMRGIVILEGKASGLSTDLPTPAQVTISTMRGDATVEIQTGDTRAQISAALRTEMASLGIACQEIVPGVISADLSTTRDVHWGGAITDDGLRMRLKLSHLYAE